MDEDATNRLAGLFAGHYDEVLAYCARRIGRVEAEDAAAEVFAVASRRVDEIDWPTARPWLYGVARGVLANRLRSSHRGRRLTERLTGMAPVPVDSPDEVVVRHAVAEEAILSLRTLESSHREVLMLAAWEGLSASEIAISLGISVAAAEKRLARAKVRFAKVLQSGTVGWSATRATLGKRSAG